MQDKLAKAPLTLSPGTWLLVFQKKPSRFPTALFCVGTHNWPGLKWAICGSSSSHVVPLLAAFSCCVGLLCSLLRSAGHRRVLFEFQKESMLRLGRLLWGLDPKAREAPSTGCKRWSRQLVSAESFRNPVVCSSEAGWLSKLWSLFGYPKF